MRSFIWVHRVHVDMHNVRVYKAQDTGPPENV